MIYFIVSLTIVLSLILLFRHGNEALKSRQSVSSFSFLAILFTTSLDGGLMLLPLVDFAIYSDTSQSNTYGFVSPLAIEFGFWGCLSWLCYFVTTCYFAIYEDKIGLFNIAWVKWANNILIVLTCSFTAWLLFATASEYLPVDAAGNAEGVIELIVLVVLAISVLTSMRINAIKYLSVASLLLVALTSAFFIIENDMTVERSLDHTLDIGTYFTNIERFVFPLSEYHEFYMYWWLAWSVMIGQFTALFVNGIKVYRLLFAILITPSIPIAVWFAILYDYTLNPFVKEETFNTIILALGCLFVVNSMDSMIRLYSINLGVSCERLGVIPYFICHFLLLAGITLLFDFQMLNIEVIGLMVFAFWLLALREILRIEYPKFNLGFFCKRQGNVNQ